MTDQAPASPDSFFPSLTAVVMAALAAGIRAFFVYTLAGAALIGVAYLIASGAGLWRGVFAAASVFAMLAATAPFVVFLAGMLAAGSGVKRLGVARSLFAAAARRAEAQHPGLREKNDFAQFSQALQAAIDSLLSEPVNLPDNVRWKKIWVTKLAGRFARRIARTLARVVMRQLELAPHPEGHVDFATIDEWMGACADAFACETLRAPARKWITIAIAMEIIGTVGILTASRTVPPLW